MYFPAHSPVSSRGFRAARARCEVTAACPTPRVLRQGRCQKGCTRARDAREERRGDVGLHVQGMQYLTCSRTRALARVRSFWQKRGAAGRQAGHEHSTRGTNGETRNGTHRRGVCTVDGRRRVRTDGGRSARVRTCAAGRRHLQQVRGSPCLGVEADGQVIHWLPTRRGQRGQPKATGERPNARPLQGLCMEPVNGT